MFFFSTLKKKKLNIWLESCITLFINFLRRSGAAYWKLWNDLCQTEMLGMLRKGQLTSLLLFFLMLKKHIHPRVDYTHACLMSVMQEPFVRWIPLKELFTAVLIISSSCLPLQPSPFTLTHQSLILAADGACRCLECIVFDFLKVKMFF